MLSKLWQNSVITSTVEYYCLPCESYMRSGSEAELHIAKPVHRKALDAAPYADGHSEDRIRKVPNGFYCEFCNQLFTASSKVRLHVADSAHRTTKGTQLLRREGTSIIAFNNVAIPEKAWNGFQGSTCVVCSKDFVFESIHKSEKEHIMKMIQSKIEFGERNSIYRKTDDGYQCLTCNEEFLHANYDAHFTSTEHKNKYEECKNSVINTQVDENHNKNDIKDQENLKKETEIPKEVKESVKPKEVKKETVKQEVKKTKAEKKNTVNNAKNSASDKTETQDPYEVDKRFREVLNANEYVSNLDNQFCMLCEVDVKESKEVHIVSSHHQKLLKLHKDRLAKRKSSNTNINESNNNDDSTLNVSNDKDSTDEKNQTSDPKEKHESKTDTNVDDNNNKDKILDSIYELTKDGINVNFETLVASCKKCNEVLEFDYDVIKSHIGDHKNKKAPADKFDWTELKEEPKNTALFSQPVTMKKGEASANVEEDKEIKEFAKKNGLEVQDNFYVCKVCAVHLNAKQVKGHVQGKAHKNRVRRQKNATPERAVSVFAQKVPMKDFIKDVSQIENIAFTDIVINLKYCINVLSFFMYTKHGGRLRCQACRVNLTMADVDIHKMEHEHQEKMESTVVVTSIQDEFIREVQPQVLHCGYCNLAVDESDMQNHLASAQHKEIKRSMLARLHQYLPIIRERRRQEAGMQALFVHMIARAAMMHNDF